MQMAIMIVRDAHTTISDTADYTHAYSGASREAIVGRGRGVSLRFLTWVHADRFSDDFTFTNTGMSTSFSYSECMPTASK
jgi:hypothetical protein